MAGGDRLWDESRVGTRAGGMALRERQGPSHPAWTDQALTKAGALGLGLRRSAQDRAEAEGKRARVPESHETALSSTYGRLSALPRCSPLTRTNQQHTPNNTQRQHLWQAGVQWVGRESRVRSETARVAGVKPGREGRFSPIVRFSGSPGQCAG